MHISIIFYKYFNKHEKYGILREYFLDILEEYYINIQEKIMKTFYDYSKNI
jgi:hypothetical protein